MKREVISEAINNLKEEYIRETDEFQTAKKTKKRNWRKWLPLTACLCLAITGISCFTLFKLAHPWPVKYVQAPNATSAEEPLSETARIPHWDELLIYEQYNSLEWNGEAYTSQSTQIPLERIDEFLGDAIAIGWDDYAELAGEDGKHQTGAKVYSITKISPESVIAVQYEGTDTWYAFLNHSYRPQTLGQFIEDLNLREEVVFNTIYYSFTNPFGDYVNVTFENVDNDIIWEWLLSEPEAENVYDESQLHLIPKRILGISTDIPLWGSKNISLSVHEDGYIKTNILATGKLFYIGEEKTQGFVDYVLKECEGYETIHVSEEPSVPESNAENPTVIEMEGASSPSVSGSHE